ncbi:mCG16609, isoform CRA_b [Mus musculus]|nr:mCG16609, isoform CRA_b [Mus musculus]
MEATTGTLQPPHLARTQSVQQQPKKKKIHSIKMRPDTYVKKHFKHLSGSNCKSRNMNNQDNRPPLEVSNSIAISNIWEKQCS